MQYRDFGRLDFRPSALGFGAMRLPALTDDDGKPDFKQIDYPLATEMLHRAIDAGSTTWIPPTSTTAATARRGRGGAAGRVPGKGQGRHQDARVDDRFAGRHGPRPGPSNWSGCGGPHSIYYLLHSLDAAPGSAARRRTSGLAAELALAEGASAISASGSTGPGGLQAIVAATTSGSTSRSSTTTWTRNSRPAAKGSRLAAAKGLSVIVMEPVRGGALAGNVPPAVQAVWAEAPVKRSPAEWALQWVWSHPEVSFLLSGMNTMEQVEQNLEYADRSRPGLLTGEELALVARVRDLYHELSPIPCTSCRYCMPCPQGVAIPDLFDLYNDAHMYDNLRRQQMAYGMFFSDDERADRCTACGECVEKCPQGIAVPEWLEKVQSFLVPC